MSPLGQIKKYFEQLKESRELFRLECMDSDLKRIELQFKLNRLEMAAKAVMQDAVRTELDENQFYITEWSYLKLRDVLLENQK